MGHAQGKLRALLYVAVFCHLAVPRRLATKGQNVSDPPTQQKMDKRKR